MITPDLKQWRKTLKPGDKVLAVIRVRNQIVDWRLATLTRIDNGLPYLGQARRPTSWATLLPAEMKEELDADKAAKDAERKARWAEREAAVKATWAAGADVVFDGSNYRLRPDFRPRDIVGFRVMP